MTATKLEDLHCIAFDVETTRIPRHFPWIEGAQLCTIGMYSSKGWSKAWTVYSNTASTVQPLPEILKEVRLAIADADYLVAQNAKFDLTWFTHYGIIIPETTKVWCTQVTDYLLWCQQKKSRHLNDLARRYGLGEQKYDEVKEQWEKDIETYDIKEETVNKYCIQDCKLTLDIFRKQSPLVEECNLFPLITIYSSLYQIVAEMEYNGITFDKEKAINFVETLSEELDPHTSRMQEIAEFKFNPSSAAQLSSILFGGELKEKYREHYTTTLKNGTVKERSRWAERTIQHKGLGFIPKDEWKSEKTGKYSSGKDILDQLKPKTSEQEEFLAHAKEKGKLLKAISSLQGSKKGSGLINKVFPDGKLHPRFNLTTTITGRFSSSEPNAQNFPRKGTSPIKKCIVPENDCIVNADLAQMEFRVAMASANDERGLKQIREGLDVHSDNAITFLNAKPGDADFKEKRNIAKRMTFGNIYGKTPKGYFEDPTFPDYSLKKWRDIHRTFYTNYAGLSAWIKKNEDFVTKNGGLLIGPTGRRFMIPSHTALSGERRYSKQKIQNYPVQGPSFDIVALAMCIIWQEMKRLGFKSKLIMQVHDSMVFDAMYEEVQALNTLCVKVFRQLPEFIKQVWNWDFNSPLDGDCEVGPTYGEVVKLDMPLDTSKFSGCILYDRDDPKDAKNYRELPYTSYKELVNSPEYKKFQDEHGRLDLIKFIK